ncbi:MAG: GIY-YIG nuclease family protein, partial [Syntrophaceae bacterium]|nr:GIY-YIG nuclease family protein [Syntrophaceae bacterium]
MKTATIKLFLVNGDPNRLKTAEISNWTGKAISGPRSDFEDILGRPESEQTGVYFLYGVDPETGESAVYIGEAAIIKQRLKQHLAKDYWNTIVFVVSKDENLNKAHA